MKNAILSLAVTLALLAPAAGGQAPSLRKEANVTGDTVLYGDLVEEAGEHAAIPLFRAPALGGVGSIRADRIAEAARDLGLAAPDPRGLEAVIIRRPSRPLSPDDLTRALGDALALRDPDYAGAKITLDPTTLPARVAAGAGAVLADIAALDSRTGRFSAKLPGLDTPVSGAAEIAVSVPTLNRGVGKGDVIYAHDITMLKLARRSVALTTVQDTKVLVGALARRALQPGQPLRDGDVMRPDLVEKNQAVTVTYDMPGMVLTLRGRALANGPQGATVSVLNPASKRTIEAVVTGNGHVTARADAARPDATLANRKQ